MNRKIQYLILGMLTVFLVAGCGKQPTEEINAAKASVDAVVEEGAQKYAAEEAKMLNDEMQAAQDEIKIQDGKTFKDYAKAKELLAKVKADAETLKAGLAAKKEEAKNGAAAAQEAAVAAITEAKTLLESAPKGKGSKADLEAFKADLKGIEDSLAEVKTANDSEDYGVAIEKSNAIKEKATAISNQVNEAMAKVGTKNQ